MELLSNLTICKLFPRNAVDLFSVDRVVKVAHTSRVKRLTI